MKVLGFFSVFPKEIQVQVLAGNRLRILKHSPVTDAGEDPFCVCLGNVASGSPQDGFQLQLSTILGFKGVLYRESAVLLRALGCTCRSLMDTLDGSAAYSFSSICSPSLIQSKQCDLPHLMNDPKIFLAKLQVSDRKNNQPYLYFLAKPPLLGDSPIRTFVRTQRSAERRGLHQTGRSERLCSVPDNGERNPG